MHDFEFRPVGPPDHGYCWSIYRDAIRPLALELMDWNEVVQHQMVEGILADAGASILLQNREAAGWLHVDETRFEIHLGHFYLEPQAQNHGLGSKFMRWMNERARRKNKALSLDMLKNNRARVFAERLGFRVASTSGNMLRMRLQDSA